MVSSQLCLSKFDEVLPVLTGAFRKLEDVLPPPVAVATAHGLAPRYRPELTEHALLMKFARLISNTSAMRVLVESGHINEQGMLQRVADETGEDILFLVMGMNGGMRAIHRSYLKHFWQEEFDGAADPKTYRPRHMVRRSEIREYIAKQSPASAVVAGDVGRMIYGVFSGFVHGASTHIYDLIDPHTRRYQLQGVRHNTDSLGYLWNAINYPLRALMSGALVAKGLGDDPVATALTSKSGEIMAWLHEIE